LLCYEPLDYAKEERGPSGVVWALKMVPLAIDNFIITSIVAFVFVFVVLVFPCIIIIIIITLGGQIVVQNT